MLSHLLVVSCHCHFRSGTFTKIHRSFTFNGRASTPQETVDGLRSGHVHRRPPAAARAVLPAAVPGPHQPHVPARRHPPRARVRRHHLPRPPFQRPRRVPPPGLRLRPRPRRRHAGRQPGHGADHPRPHPRHEPRVRGAVPGPPRRGAGASPGGGRRRRVPRRRRTPADAAGRGARARRADASAAHRQRRLLPLVHGVPHALRQRLPASSRLVAAGRAGGRAAAVPRRRLVVRQKRRRAWPAARGAFPGGDGGDDLRGSRPRHLRRARGRRARVPPARPGRPGVRRRPATHTLAGGVEQPTAAGPPLPGLARRAIPIVRALRQLRQPRQHVRRRSRGNSLGHSRQRPPFPLGAPAGPRLRRAAVVPARGLRRRDARPGRGGQLGAAGGGPVAPGSGRVLDALRVELDDGERVRRRADALPAVLRRPDGERQVRGPGVASRRHPRQRAREGKGGGCHCRADGRRTRARRRDAAEGAGAEEKRGGEHRQRGQVVLPQRRQARQPDPVAVAAEISYTAWAGNSPMFDEILHYYVSN